ncbi:glycosyltransferase family 2 protein [Candidatus Woesearchaeota archaeon]|nr:glycosyltransferase family 2 protein [Candidatus Woesearchaeota archaeon]
MKTIAIIPAYNEEKHIKKVILNVRKYVDCVLAINDGSKDKTIKEIKKTKCEFIDFKENKGKGNAMKAGIEYAISNKFDVLVFIDADGQHDASEIPKLISEIKKGYDIIIGRRKKRHSSMPLIRRVSNFIASSLVSLVIRQDIRDVQSGYRAISVSKLKGLKFVSQRYDIEAEMLIKLARNKAKIKEVIVKTIYADETSTVHLIKDTYQFFRMLFKGIKWEYF